jgi:hypothetical protein
VAARVHGVGFAISEMGPPPRPQGVLDVVNMTGKLVKAFAGLDQVGGEVHLQWVIYFPWVPEQGKFKGEVIYSIRQL